MRHNHQVRLALSIASILSILSILGCRSPEQAASQENKSPQKQSAQAGRDARQETNAETDQSQEQNQEAAPVAPKARDVGAMTVTAHAEFHDLGKRQLELEQQRARSTARHQASAVGMLLGVALIAFTSSPLFHTAQAKTRARLFAFGIIAASCLIPILIP